MIQFRVDAVPVAQPRQRTRVYRVGGRTIAGNYTPADHPVNAFKAMVKLCWKQTKAATIDGPVVLKLIFVFPRPKSRKGNKFYREPKLGKPDADNLAKSVLDSLNGLAWKDDSQVYDLRVMKYECSMDDTPHVEVLIG